MKVNRMKPKSQDRRGDIVKGKKKKSKNLDCKEAVFQPQNVNPKHIKGAKEINSQ